MLELKVSSAALKTLYGGGRSLIVDALVADTVSTLTGSRYHVLHAHSDGRITVAGEAADSARLSLPGVPAGLCGFILLEGIKGIYAEWGGERLLAKGRAAYPVCLLGADRAGDQQAIATFLIDMQGELIEAVSGNASALEAQLVYLRQASERMMTSLTIAERIMDSVGYENIMPVATLMPGKATLKLDVDGGDSFEQILPVDGLGLAALSLHVKDRAKGNGQITLRLRRDFDGKILAEAGRGYAQLKAGWNMFRFEDIVTDVMGDLRLEILGRSERKGDVPVFSMAATKADRFGSKGKGESLALELFKNIFRPDIASQELEEYRAKSGTVSVKTCPGFFPDRVGFYGGEARLAAAAGEVRFAPLQLSVDYGWVQAHLASDGVTGITVAQQVHAADRGIALDVEVPETRAPFMLVRAVYVRTLDNIESVVHGFAADTVDGTHVLAHASTVLGGGAKHRFELTFDKGVDAEGFVVIYARTLDERVDNGWIRLKSVERLHRPKTLAPQSAAGTLASADQRWLVRALRPPELSGLVEFIEGAEMLESLSIQNGFSPLLLDENGGYLQTHPLRDRISGAVVPSLATAGTRKLIATAGTAHPAAPEFIYVLAVRPHSGTPLKALLDKVADAASDPAVQGGAQQVTDGAIWAARCLPATKQARIELEFADPLPVNHDVVFATLSIGGVNSYGWCRWTSIGLVSSDGNYNG